MLIIGGGGGLCMYDYVDTKGIWEISEPPCQFYCKLNKTALKKVSLIKQTNKNE